MFSRKKHYIQKNKILDPLLSYFLHLVISVLTTPVHLYIISSIKSLILGVIPSICVIIVGFNINIYTYTYTYTYIYIYLFYHIFF